MSDHPPDSEAVRPHILRIIASMLLCFSLTTACDDSFSPLQDAQLPFSMYGFLNAKADTQWIRVTAIRNSVHTIDAPLDARVVLTDITANRDIELSYAPTRFSSPDPDRIADLYTHVFWTTYPLLAGGRYLLTATRSDGARSTADVLVPPDITSVSVDVRLSNAVNVLSDFVEVEGPEHLALVYVLHHRVASSFQDPLQRVRLSPSRNRIRVSRLFSPGPDSDPEVCTKGRLCDIRIISSGRKWPFEPRLSDDAVLHGELGNIDNGSGFVDGINSIIVPYESCAREGRSGPNDVCRLTYDGESGWLLGRLYDPACENEPIIAARITLKQIGGDRTRGTRSESTGEFRMGALEPGSTYDMVIEAQDFEPVAERLSFGVGDRKVRELGMVRTAGECGPV